jgi:type I restriction enzyme, S subunit
MTTPKYAETGENLDTEILPPSLRVPPDWRVKPLGEVVEILDSSRRPLNAAERRAMQGPFPYFGANGIVDRIDRWIFDEPLILLAEDGGYFDEFQTRPIAYVVEGKCWVNNHAHVLRVRSDHDRGWIYYALAHRDIRPFINSGTRSKLNQADLRRIPVPLPPLPEQRKIAAILSSIDDRIGKNHAVTDQVREVRKGLVHGLLGRGLPELSSATNY